MTHYVEIRHTEVFADGTDGGNPCPVVLDAGSLSELEMRSIARHYGHESGFVVSEPGQPIVLRYFVPNHEMSMCVHATAAAVALLDSAGRLPEHDTTVEAPVGRLRVRLDLAGTRPRVAIEQLPPRFLGDQRPSRQEVCAALGIDPADLAAGLPVESVSVSRPKLIVPLRSPEVLTALAPDFAVVKELCLRDETTGFYPFAVAGDHLEARQFPADSGYPEDAATGVAAGALAAYVRRHAPDLAGDGWIRIRQGRTMGRPSLLEARAAGAGDELRVEVRGEVTLGPTEVLDLGQVVGPAS
jgi:PhzF family phenazine biosynthesis protein